jgi:hypothetical protein
MTSLTNQILSGIQKMGCECSEICKTCIHLNVPTEEAPCKGCKHGSMGGAKDNYSKRVTGKDKLISSVKTKKDTEKEPPMDNEESDMSYGGSGNVSNTPPSTTEKRAYENKILLDVLRSLKK